MKNILKQLEKEFNILFEISQDKKCLDIIEDDYVTAISKKELKHLMNELHLIYYEMRE